jgi:hypothetical protein
MANKTIQQLIASGALVGSTTFETQLAGGGASQFGTLTQLLTFIQGNASAFTQGTVAFSGTLSVGGTKISLVAADGSANFANNNAGCDSFGGFFGTSFLVGVGIIELFADGHAQFANGVVTISSTDDVEITDTTKGYILKSPNGTRYRIKVSDVGVLTTQAA